MIFIDSRFEELADKNASFSSDKYSFVKIDESCSAGVIISDKRFPPTSKALIEKHNEAGSVFIALLDKHTLPEHAIENMLELGIKNKIAVYMGVPVHKNGYVIVGDFVNEPEKDYMTTKIKLTAVGMNLFECPVYCLDVLFEQVEQHVLATAPMEIYPSYIEYRMVDDWRAMVAGMPLLDYEKANSLYAKYGDVPVIDILYALTDEERNKTGFGKVICDSLRDWIGIPDEFNIGLVWKDEE